MLLQLALLLVHMLACSWQHVIKCAIQKRSYLCPQPFHCDLAAPDELQLGFDALLGCRHLAGDAINEAAHVVIFASVAGLQRMQLLPQSRLMICKRMCEPAQSHYPSGVYLLSLLQLGHSLCQRLLHELW